MATTPVIKLHTARQVALMLSVSESKVWQLIRSGDLDTVKIGWSRRIVAASVDDYIKKLQAQAASA